MDWFFFESNNINTFSISSFNSLYREAISSVVPLNRLELQFLLYSDVNIFQNLKCTSTIQLAPKWCFENINHLEITLSIFNIFRMNGEFRMSFGRLYFQYNIEIKFLWISIHIFKFKIVFITANSSLEINNFEIRGTQTYLIKFEIQFNAINERDQIFECLFGHIFQDHWKNEANLYVWLRSMNIQINYRINWYFGTYCLKIRWHCW